MIRRMTGKGEGGMLRQFIPATIADNPDTLRNDPSYVDKLEGVGDPRTARALLEGDWDVVSDAMFGTSWKKTLHVIDPFAIPKGWDLWRGADDGFSKPACILWFARDPIRDRTYAIKEVYPERDATGRNGPGSARGRQDHPDSRDRWNVL